MKRLIPTILILLLLTGCGAAAEAEVTPTPIQAPAYAFREDAYPLVMGGAAQEVLGDALAAVMLGKSRDQVSGLGVFGSTGMAYDALSEGECGLVLALELAVAVPQLETAQIALDALVFYVSADNPVDSLTSEDIRSIYGGSASSWSEFGGDDVAITAFQHSASSGSQAAMERLVMTGGLADPPKDYFPAADGSVTEAVAGFDGSAGAIGYTTYYYAAVMGIAEEYKILAVDGVEPSGDTIADGSYPYVAPCMASIRSDAAQGSGERLLWEWLQSDAGQSLVSYCGYVPVRQG